MDNKSFLKDQLTKIEAEIKESKNIVNSKDQSIDQSLKDLANEELHSLKSQKEQIENSIKSIDGGYNQYEKNESKGGSVSGDAIVEIRAGAGGDEATLFAMDLYHMYERYAQSKGWKTEKTSALSFEIKGKSNSHPTSYEMLEFESGVHRVQRVPTTESSGRIHTSTATVAVLPVVTQKEVEIRPEDLKIDTFRSSGAGGQHVNKTESAIRITHIPTGVVSSCQEERSQQKNRERAMTTLRSRIYEIMQQQQKSSVDEIRSEQVGTGDRSEKIRTYNFPQDRITDHRIKKTWHNMESRLDGNIDDVLSEIKNEYAPPTPPAPLA